MKAAVIAKCVEGKQKASIARELGVDRETVTRILNEPDIRDAVDASRRRVLEWLPKAERAVEMQLDKGDDRRTPLALSVDRQVQQLEKGRIVKIPEMGGLHHRYERNSA